jgi:hypothetical protein
MTTTAAKPGVRERQRQLLAALDAAQRELVSVTTSMAGLHATLIAVLAQRGGEVTITPGTIKQVTGTKLGFSMQPGPGDGEMTLRVVTEEDVAEGLQTDPAGDDNGIIADNESNG